MLIINSNEIKIFIAKSPYLDIDWFFLELFSSCLFFTLLERIWPHKENIIFHSGWKTDFYYFLTNHVILGLLLIIINHFVSDITKWNSNLDTKEIVSSMPFIMQFILVMFLADLVQYIFHRAHHEIPFLWEFHSIHHAAEKVNWFSGFRQHFLELIITRSLILIPVFTLGFSKSVINLYLIVVGFHAIFIHTNVNFNLSWLKYIIVTPKFHHWHHSSEKIAIDKNYALHFSFIDYMFGTAVCDQKEWPKQYGVVGNYVPKSFLKQLTFPLKKSIEL